VNLDKNCRKLEISLFEAECHPLLPKKVSRKFSSGIFYGRKSKMAAKNTGKWHSLGPASAYLLKKLEKHCTFSL